jgi:hypothetical protein
LKESTFLFDHQFDSHSGVLFWRANYYFIGWRTNNDYQLKWNKTIAKLLLFTKEKYWLEQLSKISLTQFKNNFHSSKEDIDNDFTLTEPGYSQKDISWMNGLLNCRAQFGCFGI